VTAEVGWDLKGLGAKRVCVFTDAKIAKLRPLTKALEARARLPPMRLRMPVWCGAPTRVLLWAQSLVAAGVPHAVYDRCMHACVRACGVHARQVLRVCAACCDVCAVCPCAAVFVCACVRACLCVRACVCAVGMCVCGHAWCDIASA
jgi:hypothetical protein